MFGFNKKEVKTFKYTYRGQGYDTKADYVEGLLNSGQRVSQYDLYKRHFIEGAPMPTRLSAIIYDLKQKGINVKKQTKQGKGTHYAEYYI